VDSPLDNFGVAVEVHALTGDITRGWLYGKIPVGVFVALDADGREIRWVPDLDWMSYRHQEPLASFAPSDQRERSQDFRELGEQLDRSLREALDRMDLSHIRDVGARLRSAWLDLRSRDEVPFWSSWEPFVIARDAYFEFLDEANQTGLAGLITEYEPRFRRHLSVGLLPLFDAELISTSELESLLTEARSVEVRLESDLGRAKLEQLSATVIGVTSETVLGPAGDDLPNPGRGKRFRWAKGWISVAAGGLLAVGDVALGTAAVLAGGLTTAALATTGHLGPLVGSVVTGAKLALAGLDDLSQVAQETA
jgi:hypothetical protein